MSRAFLLALLLVPALAAAPGGKDKPVYYFPTKVGDARVYETTTGGKTTASSDEVTKVEIKDEALQVSTSRTVNGRTNPVRITVVTERAVYSPFGAKGGDMTNPVLKLPAKAGESWTYEPQPPPGAAADPNGMKTTYTTGKEEEVEVPAGKFRAVAVEMGVVFNGKDYGKTTNWYAPGVGLVKSVSATSTTVLKSFTPGK